MDRFSEFRQDWNPVCTLDKNPSLVTPTRYSAAKDFGVWRQACFIMPRKQDPKKQQKHDGHEGTSTVVLRGGLNLSMKKLR